MLILKKRKKGKKTAMQFKKKACKNVCECVNEAYINKVF